VIEWCPGRNGYDRTSNICICRIIDRHSHTYAHTDTCEHIQTCVIICICSWRDKRLLKYLMEAYLLICSVKDYGTCLNTKIRAYLLKYSIHGYWYLLRYSIKAYLHTSTGLLSLNCLKSSLKITCLGTHMGLASNWPLGPSMKYVTLFFTNFDPLPPFVTLRHTSRNLQRMSHFGTRKS